MKSRAAAPLMLALGWWIFNLQKFWRSSAEWNDGFVVFGLAAWLLFQTRAPAHPPAARSVSPPATGGGAISAAFLASGYGLAFAGILALISAELHKTVFGVTPMYLLELSVASILVLSALVLRRHGASALRQLAFPAAFFCLALPCPGLLCQPLISFLQERIAAGAALLLTLLGVPAFQQAKTIVLPQQVIGIAEACSGIRGLHAAAVTAIFLGHVSLRSVSCRTILLALSLLSALAANACRSAALALIACRFGAGAQTRFHQAIGWAAFVSMAAAILIALLLLQKLEAARGSQGNSDECSRRSPHRSWTV